MSRDVFGNGGEFSGFGDDFDLGDLPPVVAQQVKQAAQAQATTAAGKVTPSQVNQILPTQLQAGNVGNLNKTIWPFFFTHLPVTLAPSSSIETSITVTQEAAFILMQAVKVVYKRLGTVGLYQYILVDPSDCDLNIAHTNGLKLSILDAQSTRNFYQRATPIDMMGSAEFPTVYPAPQMFMPNATITIQYANENLVDTFTPRVMLFGYRVRVDDARSLLSLVKG